MSVIEQMVDSPTVEKTSPYQRLCSLIEAKPFENQIEISSFSETEVIANKSLDERMAAALHVLLNFSSNEEQSIERIDKALLDKFIAQIDELMSKQLDAILHNDEVQKVESLWKGLHYVVSRTDFRANNKIELLDVDKDELSDDFDDAAELSQSGLYKHVYVAEYDTPGGEPFTSMIAPYEFSASGPDIALLRNLSKIAASSHCPFIANVGAKFFGKSSIDEVTKINDLDNYMERADYIRWNSFRESDDARYIGLTLPRFLLRVPYGDDCLVKNFQYQECTRGSQENSYLWGAASFAFAANLSRSFKENGWCVNIRGPESGGKVEQLPLHQYDGGRGLQTKIPSECLISETRELEFAELGFIPLSYYKNSDFACFFSANSTQSPPLFDTAEATANSRINSRLPYIFLSSRLAHYLKVLQRESIGSTKSRTEIEDELNRWMQTLVTKMNNPGPELAATHPLREGSVAVHAIAENPGFYRVSMAAVPHFQIEGMDVSLSLVGQLPSGKS